VPYPAAEPSGFRDARRAAPASPAAIVTQLGGEPAGPQRDIARHRLLHVGVAGQHGGALAFRERVERRRTAFRGGGELRARVEQVQPQRGQHLVVARTAKMHATAGGADARCQPLLEGGLAVLVREFDFPFARGMLIAERLQSGTNGREIGIAQECGGIQHLGVRDRSAHVIPDQPCIEGVVVPRRVPEHTIVRGACLCPTDVTFPSLFAALLLCLGQRVDVRDDQRAGAPRW
jgi:hypothetical protein